MKEERKEELKEKGMTLAQAAAGRVMPLLQRYSAALVILLAGMLLLASGGGCERTRTEPAEGERPVTDGFDLSAFEQQLVDQLAAMEGVGRVSLMLSLEETEEAVYAVNVRRTEGGAQSYESDLAVLSDRSYGETPVAVKNRLPSFRGAVVLCDGADNVMVRLAITNAVSTVCGIGSDKVTVLKMAAGT